MSIFTEIDRIQQAKDDVKAALEGKGITVSSSATIDTYNSYVQQIPIEGLIQGNITSIVIPSGVTAIAQYAFYGCASLTSVTIPDTVTSIGNYAFYGCSGLKDIHIPSGVTSIGSYVFGYCTGLSGITVDSNNATFDSRNNCNAIIAKATNKLVVGCKTTVIPNTVTIIGAGSFYYQRTLTNITIPSSVTSIEGYAFRYCTSLTSITCNAITAPTVANNAFYQIKTGGTLYTPDGSSGYDTWMGTGAYYLGYYSWKNTEFVEIAGTKWATMNVGATGVTDTGKYFQWGDVSGYTASQVGSGSGQKYFGWEDYKYTNDGGTTMTKYNSTDGKTVLDLSDDAARANWGGSWRMPTTEEFAALGTATTSAWTADYQGSGVSGLVLTDKTDSSKVLFFPAVGRCNDGSVRNAGSNGFYWSSSVYSNDVQYAYHLYFTSSRVRWQHYLNSRYGGFAVRGVVG